MSTLENAPRKSFLETIWNRYPLLYSDNRGYGRVIKIQSDGIYLRSQGQDQFFGVLESDSFIENKEAKVKLIIRMGDIVAFLGNHQWQMLSPNLLIEQKIESANQLQVGNWDFEVQKNWNKYLNLIRHFFLDREFLEVMTPSLVECPGTEPSLDVFSTILNNGSKEKKYYLPTSPELHLKKALALGAEKIFEFARCYRNNELTQIHQPEFLMLEWYRAYQVIEDIRDDLVELVYFLSQQLDLVYPEQHVSYSVSELFKIHCNFEFKPNTTETELRNLANKLNVDIKSAESIDDVFFRIFNEKIESKLNPNELTIVYNYPHFQAALARITEDGWGERFEVYWKGMELANAFGELNNPEIQRSRSHEDLEKKSKLGKEKIPLDDEFFKCLEFGMPPSAGVALGVERLFLALYNQKNISYTRSFFINQI